MFELSEVRPSSGGRPSPIGLPWQLRSFRAALYLLKIEPPPRELWWTLTIFFILFIYPARLLTGWRWTSAASRNHVLPGSLAGSHRCPSHRVVLHRRSIFHAIHIVLAPPASSSSTPSSSPFPSRTVGCISAAQCTFPAALTFLAATWSWRAKNLGNSSPKARNSARFSTRLQSTY